MKRVFLGLYFCCSLFATAQITHPKASPFAIVEQQLGLSNIRIEYSRPAVKGRHVFGPQDDGQKGLVPYGRIWRVGANESTKIHVDADMKIMGNTLPKGTYALYAFPGSEYWEIALHTNIGHWGDGRTAYDPAEDLFRIRLRPQRLSYHQENFLISFDSITHNAALLQLTWASTRIEIPIEVDTQAMMEAEITNKLESLPTAQTYYEAARYLQEQGIDTRRALGYVDKALELGGDTYYFHRVKSLLQADLKDFIGAIASAQKSRTIAAELGNDEFVRMNEKNIRAWTILLED